MTRMTSGYKTHAEREMELQKKKEEYNNRPVPIEWQVERYERGLNKHYDNYMEQLEKQAQMEREMRAAEKASTDIMSKLAAPPPPPPPLEGRVQGSSQDGLPNLIGNPMGSFKRY